MAEWFKAHAWKVCVLLKVPRVRIPVSPPALTTVLEYHKNLSIYKLIIFQFSNNFFTVYKCKGALAIKFNVFKFTNIFIFISKSKSALAQCLFRNIVILTKW